MDLHDNLSKSCVQQLQCLLFRLNLWGIRSVGNLHIHGNCGRRHIFCVLLWQWRSLQNWTKAPCNSSSSHHNDHDSSHGGFYQLCWAMHRPIVLDGVAFRSLHCTVPQAIIYMASHPCIPDSESWAALRTLLERALSRWVVCIATLCVACLSLHAFCRLTRPGIKMGRLALLFSCCYLSTSLAVIILLCMPWYQDGRLGV